MRREAQNAECKMQSEPHDSGVWYGWSSFVSCCSMGPGRCSSSWSNDFEITRWFALTSIARTMKAPTIPHENCGRRRGGLAKRGKCADPVKIGPLCTYTYVHYLPFDCKGIL